MVNCIVYLLGLYYLCPHVVAMLKQLYKSKMQIVSNMRISIIIPVYNVEPYVENVFCLFLGKLF